MGFRTVLKTGTIGVSVARTRRLDGAAFDYSGGGWSVLASARDVAGPTTLYVDRDVTVECLAEGVPSAGGVVIPQWSGRGLPGAAVGAVVTGAGDAVTVTAAASGIASVVRQELYMTKAGGPTWYLVGYGPDGWLAAGVVIGNPAYVAPLGVWVNGLSEGTPGVDTLLLQAAPTRDESRTNGATAVVAVPAITSAVLAPIGTGTLTPGAHDFRLVNLRAPDSVLPRVVEVETKFWNLATGSVLPLPTGDWDEIEYIEAID